MPNIKAAEKWARQSQKRRERNVDTKTRLKTLFKKAKADGSPPAVAAAEGAFDRAASKGIIHPNKAARKKSRLAKAVTLAQTQAAAAKEAAPAKKSGGTATKRRTAAKR